MLCNTLTLLYSHKNATWLRDSTFVSGVIFGISASPDIPLPETWMPWVVKAKQGESLSEACSEQLADALMEQLKWQLQRMRNQQSLLPTGCEWASEKSHRSVIEGWLHGVLFAHNQLEPIWKRVWEFASAEDQKSLHRCLKAFSFLADTELTLANTASEKRSQMLGNMPVLAAQLPTLLKEYVALADKLARHLPGQFEVFQSDA